MAHPSASVARLDEPIAIVGVACRFPGGANDLDTYWHLLRNGVDAVREIDRDGLEPARLYDARPQTPGRMSTKWGGLLDGLDRFDAAFFGISPREAETVSPEQRLLLEIVWEAYEDAGIDPSALAGRPVGVYVGQWINDYEDRLFANLDELSFHGTTGSGRYATAGRISYVFDSTGPSMTVDTACSSSLVAVHLACQALRTGEASLAVAAGVNVLLEPPISVAYSQSSMMALDGRCKFGDATGDGYVRSEGAAVVLLERLTEARAAGHRVHAIIRGSAVNNDGHSSGRLSTPSVRGQAAVLRAAYAAAGVDPATVDYVEAHGTGTRAGDPVELAALAEVLSGSDTSGAGARARHVGSVKTNIGHTEGAAGLAGLLKCVAMLQHREVPPSLHFTEPNPDIPWDDIPFTIPTTTEPWPAGAGAPRRAGVTALGITGTNAHVVLEEAPSAALAPEPRPATDAADVVVPLVLSAASPHALAQMAGDWAQLLTRPGGPALADVAAEAALRRAALEHSAVLVCSSAEEAATRLRRIAAGDVDAAADATGRTLRRRDRRIGFVFPGQGGQWVGMGRELLVSEPAFAAAIDRCDAALPAGTEWRVREQLESEPGSAVHRLDDIAVLQPTLLAVQIALAETWRAWGVEPVAVVGHSMGEVGAAHLAGVLTLEDAMLVICRRSALMARAAGAGAMAAIELTAPETAERIARYAGRVVVAAENSPRNTVVSGDRDDVEALVDECTRDGVFARAVKVDVASHSPHVDPFVGELVADLTAAELRPRRSAIALYSTVDAERVEGDGLDAGHWGRNLRRTVRFGPAVERMLADGIDTFVELSPHPTLLPALGQIGDAASRPLAVGSLRRGEPERAAMLAALGALWASGHRVDWSIQFPDAGSRRVRLPHYPWQRVRHWSSAAAPLSAGHQRTGTPAIPAEAGDWMLHHEWQPAPTSGAPRIDGDWMVVGEAEAAAAFARALASAGASARTTQALETADGLAGVVVLPSADEIAQPEALLDALRMYTTGSGARLWWLTHGAAHLDGDPPCPTAVAGAALAATVRAAGVETPDAWGGVVDLDPAQSADAQADAAVGAIASGDGEDTMALRRGVRHVRRVVPASPPAAPRFVWRPDRAYLVTGGFGGIAQHVAQSMVANGARRLVLTTRTALPPRPEWAAVQPTTEIGRRIAAVRALEHAGASVHVIVADAADVTRTREALAVYAAEGWPEIAGVVHTAGVDDSRLIGDLTSASLAAVLGPKLRGAQILDELLPDVELFVLFSSMHSFWPMAGVANYAAANAGLDALAEQRRARGRHALSIQWGPWPSVGMFASAVRESTAAGLRDAGVGEILPQQGTAWFERLLGDTAPVVAVLPVDWLRFHDQMRGREPALFRATPGAGAAASGGGLVRRIAEAGVVERRALLESLVRDTVGQVLHLPPAELDGDRPFGSFGLDSLMAIELRNRLEATLERPLSATLAWNHPTVTGLAVHLEELLAGPGAPPRSMPADTVVAGGLPVDGASEITSSLAAVATLSDDEVLQALRGGR